jgi:hypothetical protein
MGRGEETVTPLEWVAVVAPAAWLADNVIRPWSPCPVCGGRGRHGLSGPRAFGNCPFCGGSGKRLRFGARMVRRAVRRKERR